MFALYLRLIRVPFFPPRSTFGEYAVPAKSGAPGKHKTCTLKRSMTEVSFSLPLAFLIGHIMGITFCLGDPTTLARSEKVLLVAPRPRSGFHDKLGTYTGDCQGPLHESLSPNQKTADIVGYGCN